MQLQSRLEDFEAQGAKIWGVSPDDPDRQRSFVEAEGIEFPILVDPDSAASVVWGIYNEEHHRHGPIPHPTTVVVDRAGVVRFVEINENYRERPVPERLMETLRLLAPTEG